MKPVHVFSEIQPLKKVLLHRPGRELLNLVPHRLNELLFDDIPFLKIAQQEHDAFAQILKDNGVEVVYLEDLVSEVFEQHPEVLETFLYQWLYEGNIKTKKWQDKLYHYLLENYQGKELVLKTMEGIALREMDDVQAYSLQDRIAPSDDLIVDPMPNLYFTRDPFACIGNGISLNHMRYEIRRRETIYAEFIFKYHKEYAGKVKKYYDRFHHASIEGGDILNLSKHVLAIGISERTSPDAIEKIAAEIFKDEDSFIHTILAFQIPSIRAYMHLDTVFTQIDQNRFMVHPGILGPLSVYEIKKGKKEYQIKEIQLPLQEVLEKYLKKDIELLYCGGDDSITSAREQWNDGSNTLAIAPGKVIVYDRNEKSNEVLRNAGLTVLEMPSCELSRGRGGPRCMSMPLQRLEEGEK